MKYVERAIIKPLVSLVVDQRGLPPALPAFVFCQIRLKKRLRSRSFSQVQSTNPEPELLTCDVGVYWGYLQSMVFGRGFGVFPFFHGVVGRSPYFNTLPCAHMRSIRSKDVKAQVHGFVSAYEMCLFLSGLVFGTAPQHHKKRKSH